jgi:hypothetical protein
LRGAPGFDKDQTDTFFSKGHFLWHVNSP